LELRVVKGCPGMKGKKGKQERKEKEGGEFSAGDPKNFTPELACSYQFREKPVRGEKGRRKVLPIMVKM